jgi:hypothetical protein
LPNVNAGLDTTICRNTSYTLKATGANSYTWYGNTSTLNCINCPSPIAKPLTTITYAVVGKNSFNCVATDSITIRVQQPLKLNVQSGDTLCLGETAAIKATGTDQYSWYPSLYVDNANKGEVNIRPAKDTTITYRVIGKDNFNCFADTASVKIKTFPIPKMQFDQNEFTVNAGYSVKLKTTSSKDITKWKWTPNRFIDNDKLAEPTMIARESITYTCVASNEGNCVTRDEVKVIVVCNNGNIFVPIHLLQMAMVTMIFFILEVREFILSKTSEYSIVGVNWFLNVLTFKPMMQMLVGMELLKDKNFLLMLMCTV